MKKPILAMALALTLACGSFLGFLPGKGVMTVKASEAGVTIGSTEDAEEQLQAPTNIQWGSVWQGTNWRHDSGLLFRSCPAFEGDRNLQYEIELYRNGELYKTVTCDRVSASWKAGQLLATRAGIIWGWESIDENTGEPIRDTLSIGEWEEGKYTFRVRAVSGDKKSEWSDFSNEGDNTREAFLAAWAEHISGTNNSEVGSSDDSESVDDNNDTVPTSTGEVLTSSAAINVTGTTPAVLRTPQSTVTAAVGGLKEGQYVMASVGGSACGELARQAVTNAAGSMNGKVASYLEITLDVYNREGGMDQTVTQLSAPIEFTLAAPADLDGNQYDFAVIRLHGDGKVDILPDLDDDPVTITFRTDRFSVYAVIYGTKGAFKTSGGKDRVPKTGDGAVPLLPFAAASAVCSAAAVILGRKARV